MSALTLLIVLAFMAVLAALLALWFTVTLATRAEAMRRQSEDRPEPAPRPADLSNDAVRGAKAPRKSMPIDVAAELSAQRKERDRARTETSQSGSGATPSRPPRPEGDPFDRFLDRDRKRDEF